MKYTFVIIVASLAVLTAQKPKRHRKEASSVSEENRSLSLEDKDLVWVGDDSGLIKFDLNGTLRRSFALIAALEQPTRNLILSPVSALLPLGKLVLGTDRGKSRDELLDALGYKANKVKKRLRSMIKKLKYLPGVTLSISSTIYVSMEHKLKSKYAKDTKTVFGSTCEKLNFEKAIEAAAVINNKVKQTTNGYIPQIITPSEISPSASVILVNAIYFSGRWQESFKDVKVGDFHSPSGVRKVPMMTSVSNYNYSVSDSLGAAIIEIPYEKNTASFMIVLPNHQNSLTLLLTQLKVAPEMLNTALNSMSDYRVRLTMPKFKITSELDLKDLYEKIGVKSIFQHSDANLNRIINSDDKLHVSKAVQKAYIEVSEKGTKAAAATSLQVVAVSWPPKTVDFIANRPFLFFIKSDKEQLFAGIFNGESN